MAKYTRTTIKEEYIDCQPRTEAPSTGYKVVGDDEKPIEQEEEREEIETGNKSISLERLREIFVTNKEFKMAKGFGMVIITILLALFFLIPLILNQKDHNEIKKAKNEITNFIENQKQENEKRMLNERNKTTPNSE